MSSFLFFYEKALPIWGWVFLLWGMGFLVCGFFLRSFRKWALYVWLYWVLLGCLFWGVHGLLYHESVSLLVSIVALWMSWFFVQEVQKMLQKAFWYPFPVWFQKDWKKIPHLKVHIEHVCFQVLALDEEYVLLKKEKIQRSSVFSQKTQSQTKLHEGVMQSSSQKGVSQNNSNKKNQGDKKNVGNGGEDKNMPFHVCLKWCLFKNTFSQSALLVWKDLSKELFCFQMHTESFSQKQKWRFFYDYMQEFGFGKSFF